MVSSTTSSLLLTLTPFCAGRLYTHWQATSSALFRGGSLVAASMTSVFTLYQWIRWGSMMTHMGTTRSGALLSQNSRLGHFSTVIVA